MSSLSAILIVLTCVGQISPLVIPSSDIQHRSMAEKESLSAGRVRRAVFTLRNRPMCDNSGFPSAVQCSPNDWLFHLKIRGSCFTYYVTCTVDPQTKALCKPFEHLFSSMVCYTVSCPRAVD